MTDITKHVAQLLTSIMLCVPGMAFAQQSPTAPANGNPVLPGYFADPTIKKFGDSYYLYATTDGIKLASGEPQVWISKDLTNWYNQEMDIDLPDGLTNCWAPDVVHGKDGRYYYYMGNCQFGCNIYGYVSDTPVGPWKPLNNGEAVIPVGTSKEYLPALDAQFLCDDDGSLYNYFGTWCTSFKGMGWVKINEDDMHTIEKEGFIPIEQIPQAFEAAYPIKKDSIYFLMYSSGDCRLSTYAVHYAWSRSPEGPWNYGPNSPVLETTADGLVDSPGHHSVLEKDGEYYIVYHRHDNPHSSGGEFRQVCIDKLEFTGPYTIAKVNPTHEGICFGNSVPANLALGAKASATSSYRLVADANRYTRQDVDYSYSPTFATDDNNGTMWKAASCALPQSLVVDMGKEQAIERIFTQFEYPTFYYQYKLEVSSDSVEWKLFSDQTANKTSGSPMIDDGNATARFIRITVTGTEKAGMFPAIWNVKVYGELFDTPETKNHAIPGAVGSVAAKGLLVNFDASGLKKGPVNRLKNTGLLGGTFGLNGQATVKKIAGVKAVDLGGEGFFELSEEAPQSLDWNSPFTASAWVFVPELQDGACIVAWNSRENMLQASYAAMMIGSGPYGAVAHGDGSVDLGFKTVPQAKQWHHLVVTFDGMKESVFVDGRPDRELPLMLFVKSSRILIGSSGMEHENLKGAIANVRLYDKAMTADQISQLYLETKPKGFNKK
ncbi:family 43 glycosylhydrolase [Mangrovibacterium marinum]|uniref:F5/8 type C domain-containing protein n=1 Tax=Mangrovibacterium marinum TaxID=1639118 RepID=A0A2T5BYW4_9BACT|nr:family 43 glycosylhydrolase [Mangrovibacterium marinum]PTN07450.1 F5/8 type C domain-containing protein [Mangrovibacterium marinum]